MNGKRRGMFQRRRGLIALGVSVAALCAAGPIGVSDGRLPKWANIFWDIQQGAMAANDAMHQAVASLFPPSKTTSTPIVSRATPTASTKADVAAAPADPTLADPTLNAPPAQTAAADLAGQLRTLGADPAVVRQAIGFYRAGNIAAGDNAAATITYRDARTALEWIAVREAPDKIGLGRLSAFRTAHPDWPAQNWLRMQYEAYMFRSTDSAAVLSTFAQVPPRTPTGKLALARALRDTGRKDEAVAIVRAIYRDSEMSPFLESRIKADFGADLQKADHKYRADRLLYKDDNTGALRVAALAGPDVVALERARIATGTQGAANDKALAAVPAPLRGDAGLLLAQIQRYRRAGQLKEAASFMLGASRDPAVLINPDEWWVERRVLARKILDTGDAQTAYDICAGHSAVATDAKIEAEFHAGWIALRFLNKPDLAAKHFAKAASFAETPTNIARTAYWQGRALDNSMAPNALSEAKRYYVKAALYPSTFYGQIARALPGLDNLPVATPATEAVGLDRSEATRVDELLFALGEKEAGAQLAAETAQSLKDEAQAGAFAAVISRQQDAHLSLIVGKLMGEHGFPVDQLAFPTYGIPHFDPLVNSAPVSVVYSVARQESAFNATVVSRAGAKGLMQMIDGTARQTATKAGLAFDAARLLTDAAFNAQLGAAHLGALIAEQGGSYMLTFAAYNAGGGHVKEWIAAYGDPRDPSVDPIDWIERIPFTETRHYVQRVMANVTMYRARFAANAGASDQESAKKLVLPMPPQTQQAKL